MRLREFYNRFMDELKTLYSYDEAAAISNISFEHFAGKGRAEIITQPDHVLENEKVSALENALLQLKRNIPVQYVTGHSWFMDIRFKVDPSVLIPRPETEELVNEAITFIKENHKHTVLDIGTGSGCIPVSIGHQLPHTKITAIDISEAALSVAKQNAAANNTDIEWLLLNFLDETTTRSLPAYDVIISNPPYIPEQEKQLLDKNVTAHEPHGALFVPDNDPIIFYEKIAVFGLAHLAPGGCIFMETHESFAGKVADHFAAQGYQAVIKRDLFEKERMVIANRFRSP